MTIRPIDLKTIAAALGGAFVPLSADEQRLVVEIYRALLRGEAPTADDVADRLQADPRRVQATVAEWPGAYFDKQQRIEGFWGLSRAEMAHRVTVDGRTTYAWCAFDPLFILPVAGVTGMVTSTCPVTGQRIRLTVTPDGVRDLSPHDVVVSLLAPTGRFDANVRVTFCHYVLFFASPDAGKEWTATHPDTFLLNMRDAFAIARQVNREAFPALAGHA